MDIFTVRKILRENNLLVFTPLEFQRFLNITQVAAQKILERYTKKGVFVRLKKGYYILKSNSPSSFYIANIVYGPSYISFESALSFYGIIPESIFSVTSATSKSTKDFNIFGKNFRYSKIKKEAFTGYYKRKVNDEDILIAEPEKALADCFYFISLGRRESLDRLNLQVLSKKKLYKYLELFKRKKLKKLAQEYL